MFGRTVEAKYGRKEFLSFYLVAIVVAGVSWYLTNLITKNPNSTSLLFGASGGVSAVLVLFAINYPRQNIYIWGVLPVPAWAFVVFLVGSDLLGFVKSANASLDSTRSNVAFTAHLGGALFAYLYYRNQWRVSNWIPGKLSLPGTGPKLRIHDPEDRDDKTDQKVDEILKKIQAHGQDSLTRSERRTLEKASKAYQKKNR